VQGDAEAHAREETNVDHLMDLITGGQSRKDIKKAAQAAAKAAPAKGKAGKPGKK
jgi:hypothetical protein